MEGDIILFAMTKVDPRVGILFLRPCLHGGRVALLGGLPSSIVFPGFVYMPGRATPGGGFPCLLGRVTLLGGLTFYHVKGRGRVTS